MACQETTSPQNQYEVFSMRKGRCPVHCKPPKFKYMQPPVPKSYAPIQKYEAPDFSLDGDTVYHLSYPAIEADTAKSCRPPPFPALTNICTSDQALEGDTVTGLSYQYTYQQPPLPIHPPKHDMMGCGPMQNLTTYNHDYPCKPGMRPCPVVPRGNIAMSDFKMEDSTTMNLSYQPIAKFEMAKSCKPHNCYLKPDIPFEGETVQQLSYQPYEVCPREEFPWTKKSCYEQPEYPMDGNTIYRGTYMAPGNFVPDDAECENCDVCLCVCPAATDGL